MKLWAPDYPDGCHIALTNGHTFMVPGDEVGIFVPAMFRKKAIARGCIPVGRKPEVRERDTFSGATTIRRAGRRALAALRARDGSISQTGQARDTAVDPQSLVLAETTTEAAGADNTSGASLGAAVADAIMLRLRQAGEAGLSRTAIRDAFGRNLKGLGAVLEQLQCEGRATRETMSAGRSGGRPPEVWRAVK
jgi:hypothetical protein